VCDILFILGIIQVRQSLTTPLQGETRGGGAREGRRSALNSHEGVPWKRE
jgi:hypothetical protein